MSSYQQRPTAKIYDFPAGSRSRPPPSRQHETLTTAYLPQRADKERAPKIVYGSSWYHQVAVDEA